MKWVYLAGFEPSLTIYPFPPEFQEGFFQEEHEEVRREGGKYSHTATRKPRTWQCVNPSCSPKAQLAAKQERSVLKLHDSSDVSSLDTREKENEQSSVFQQPHLSVWQALT